MWRLKGNLMHICVKNDFLTIVVWNMKKVGFRNNYIDLYLKSRRGTIGKYISAFIKYGNALLAYERIIFGGKARTKRF